jgi:hypothetical protein
VTTLYDRLGVGPGATSDDLRQAYRARARALHPDRAGGRSGAELEADSAELARLNEAWRVLSDPRARARYDAGLGADQLSGDGLAPMPGAAGASAPSEAAPPALEGAGGCLPRSVRLVPWVVLCVVLAVIFVVTAYASHPDAVTPPNVMGECLQAQPGYDLFVTCTAAGQDQVVAERSPCPPGAVAHLVQGGVRFTACLKPSGPAGSAP